MRSFAVADCGGRPLVWVRGRRVVFLPTRGDVWVETEFFQVVDVVDCRLSVEAVIEPFAGFHDLRVGIGEVRLSLCGGFV